MKEGAFEMLIVAQLVMKFFTSFGIQKAHYHVHKSPPLYSVLSQTNSIPHPIYLRFTLILFSNLCLHLPSDYSFQVFWLTCYMHFSSHPMCSSHLPLHHRPNNTWYMVKSTNTPHYAIFSIILLLSLSLSQIQIRTLTYESVHMTKNEGKFK